MMQTIAATIRYAEHRLVALWRSYGTSRDKVKRAED